MIAQWLTDARYIVVFTGAGMSTESGVPDFRSASGLWQGRDPQQLASEHAMHHHREEFIQFYRKRMERLQSIEPHAGYHILTNWSKQLHLQTIITQNTDGLHELAGNPNVLTVHGTIRQLHCHDCAKVYSSECYLDDEWLCSCGGLIRPSVVLFGESLQADVLEQAQNEASKADLFIVLGSSLVVSPANTFPMIAKQHGAKLVIINRDPTPLDDLADLVIQDRKIGEVLHEWNESLKLA